jgi:hypothetical protein
MAPAVPKEPIPVTIHVTAGAMAAVMASENDFHRVTGATHPDGSVEFNLPLLGGREPALPPGLGEFEWRYLHELNHAVVFRSFANASDLPAWIQEGLSDRLAETSVDGPLSPMGQYRIEQFRRALGTLARIPLRRLLSLDEVALHQLDAKSFALFYFECYFLNRFLDSGERHERFLSLLRELPHMRRALLPNLLAWRLGDLFGDLDALDAELETALRAEPPARWTRLYGDVRPLDHAEVALLSGRGLIAAASQPQAPLRLSATVKEADAESVMLLFAVHSDDDFCAVRFGRSQATALQCAIPNGWKKLAEAPSAGPVRHISVEIGEGKLRAIADGKVVLEAAAPPVKGGWGVGVGDGRAVFADLGR